MRFTEQIIKPTEPTPEDIPGTEWCVVEKEDDGDQRLWYTHPQWVIANRTAKEIAEAKGLDLDKFYLVRRVTSLN